MSGEISSEQEALLRSLEAAFPDPYGPVCSWMNSRPLNEALRLVHYTSFEALEKILRNKTLRFSPLARLNDKNELREGKRLLRDYLLDSQSRIRKAILSLRSVDDSLCDEIWMSFEDSIPYEHHYSFISCWSMCTTAKETYDNLAMWRGYASDGNGVAITLDPLEFGFPLERSEIAFWPVQYEQPNEFEQRVFESISSFVAVIHQQSELVSTNSHWIICRLFSDLCFYLAMTHKHPGFKAERECRLVWKRDPVPQSELWRNMKPVAVAGSYLNYFDLPIKENPALSPKPLSIQSLIKAIMIGPCENQPFAKLAIEELLRDVDHQQVLLQTSPTPYRSV